MSRMKLLALTMIVFAGSSCGSALVAGDLMQQIHVGFWRNMCWPKPFIYPDRKAANDPLMIMADNGWRRNNLLGGHHFSLDDTQLNRAGELKVRWIMTQAPIHRRNIFVERALEPELTSRRIEAAHRFATNVAVDSPVNVYDTHILAEGRSAVDVDSINVRFRESAPPPILPPPSGGTLSE